MEGSQQMRHQKTMKGEEEVIWHNKSYETQAGKVLSAHCLTNTYLINVLIFLKRFGSFKKS